MICFRRFSHPVAVQTVVSSFYNHAILLQSLNHKALSSSLVIILKLHNMNEKGKGRLEVEGERGIDRQGLISLGTFPRVLLAGGEPKTNNAHTKSDIGTPFFL